MTTAREAAVQVDRTVDVDHTGHAPVSDEDWKFCATMLPKVSRTFALSIGALPPELREPIRIAYLLCRAVDTIEDDAVVVGEARERLYDMFDLLMNDDGADPTVLERLTAQYALGKGTDDHTLCLNAGAVFRCYRALPIDQRIAIRPHVLEMSRGMREFTRRADRAGLLRLSNLDELERYCYFVAGTVGKLLTALFEDHVGELPPHLLTLIRARSVSFGLALQLVNIVKDVAEDLPRGDCFLPQDIARGEGVQLEDILEPDNRAAGMAIIRRVCERARAHLERAEQYTLLWPAEEAADVRMFCTVPLVLALATLHEVEDGSDTLVPGRTPKITRQAVTDIFADARVAIQRNDTLRWMIGYYSSGAYLNAAALPALAKERVSTMPPGLPPRPGRPSPSTAVRETTSDAVSPPAEAVDVASTTEPTPATQHVLVTGASSHLGAVTVRRLLREGRKVRVLLRQGSNNQAMDGLTVDRIYGDLHNLQSMQAAVRGCTSAVHCAGSVSPYALLQAAKDAALERVVCVRHWGNSDEHFERACLDAQADGLEVVQVETAPLIGSHDEKVSGLGRSLVDFAHGRTRSYVPGGLEVVTARDAGEGVMSALSHGQGGQTYTLASAYLSMGELMAMFEEATGVPQPRVQLPKTLARAAAKLSGRMLGKRLLGARALTRLVLSVDSVAGRRVPANLRANTRRARSELAFSPTDVQRAVIEAYEDFARRGLVPARMTIVDAATAEDDDTSTNATSAGAAA